MYLVFAMSEWTHAFLCVCVLLETNISFQQFPHKKWIFHVRTLGHRVISRVWFDHMSGGVLFVRSVFVLIFHSPFRSFHKWVSFIESRMCSNEMIGIDAEGVRTAHMQVERQSNAYKMINDRDILKICRIFFDSPPLFATSIHHFAVSEHVVPSLGTYLYVCFSATP